jgi:hypothetical protein
VDGGVAAGAVAGGGGVVLGPASAGGVGEAGEDSAGSVAVGEGATGVAGATEAGGTDAGGARGVSGFAATGGIVLGTSLVLFTGRDAGVTFGVGVGTAAICFSRGGTSIACPSQPIASPAKRATPAAMKIPVCCVDCGTGRLTERGGGLVSRAGGGGRAAPPGDIGGGAGGGDLGGGGGFTGGGPLLSPKALAATQSSIPSFQTNVVLLSVPT